MSLLAEFWEFIEKEDEKRVASALGTYPSVVGRWKAKTHTPKLEVLNKFNEFKNGKEVSKWEGKKVCILMPWYRTTNPATAFALFAMGVDYGNRITGFMELGNALIYKARNKLADQFVNSNSEYAFWADDDIIFPIGRAGWFRWINQLPSSFPESFASRHSIDRLLSHNKTIVSGLYFGRQVKGQPMYHEGLRERGSNIAARSYIDELRPTDWIPTGFKLVHRSVYEDIRAKFPDLAPRKDPGPEGSHWGYYNPIGEAGEDVSFCIRAKQAGHQPYIDLGLHATHVGYMAYGAHNTKSF
jgi:hypothetical protein